MPSRSSSSSDRLNVPSFRTLAAASVALRVALIFYSEWHDAHSVVKYTDVDYRVFTDAARFVMRPTPANEDAPANVAQGILGGWLGFGNPYTRETYRYTPLLAVLLTPNIWLHPSFGKYLFAACDILVGVLIHRLLLSTVLVSSAPPSSKEHKAVKGEPSENADKSGLERRATLYTAVYLLNPLVFSISTRGSSESTLGALVVTTLYFALHRRWDATAVMLGLATHWKIYPVIYAASLVGVISGASPRSRTTGERGIYAFAAWCGGLVNRATLRFALLSGMMFMLLGSAMYLIWGYPFFYEAYLYHLHRLDHRHNFSPYFFQIYLSYPPLAPSSATPQVDATPLWQKLLRSPLTSFAPQMALSLGTGFLFGRRKEHLPFAWFVQTATFVTFNKVCTSQYFLWYLTLLPLVLPLLSMSRYRTVALVAVWVGTQALWLKTAYDLEFLGKNVFYGLWVRSLMFLVANCWVLGEIIKGYTLTDKYGHGVSKDQ